jgi:hypothetical protein
MDLLIGFLIGIFISSIFFFFYRKILAKSLWKLRGTGRFGIVDVCGGYTEYGKIEFEELVSAGSYTKIRIIKITPNKDYKIADVLANLSQNCCEKEIWVKTNYIIWFDNNTQYIRDKKLSEILK